MAATAKQIQERLRDLGSPEAAAFAAGYFKAGPGQYGEGDRFLGIRVPVLRKLAREYRGQSTDDLTVLLHSEIHEERLLALIILVLRAERGDRAVKKQVFEFYIAHTAYVNSWDLVDVSCREIVGGFLFDDDRTILDRLAESKILWERRIAIVSTAYFIARNDHVYTLKIAETLIADPHELIHKAVGWMLREVGKRDQDTLEAFLERHHRTMPRTMLRYAIERFPEDLRRRYLKGYSVD